MTIQSSHSSTASICGISITPSLGTARQRGCLHRACCLVLAGCWLLAAASCMQQCSRVSVRRNWFCLSRLSLSHRPPPITCQRTVASYYTQPPNPSTGILPGLGAVREAVSPSRCLSCACWHPAVSSAVSVGAELWSSFSVFSFLSAAPSLASAGDQPPNS